MPLLNAFQQCGIPTWPEPAGKSGHVEPFKFSGSCALSRYIKKNVLTLTLNDTDYPSDIQAAPIQVEA